MSGPGGRRQLSLTPGTPRQRRCDERHLQTRPNRGGSDWAQLDLALRLRAVCLVARLRGVSVDEPVWPRRRTTRWCRGRSALLRVGYCFTSSPRPPARPDGVTLGASHSGCSAASGASAGCSHARGGVRIAIAGPLVNRRPRRLSFFWLRLHHFQPAVDAVSRGCGYIHLLLLGFNLLPALPLDAAASFARRCGGSGATSLATRIAAGLGAGRPLV